MQNELSLKTALYKAQHKRRRIWKRFFTGLASVVVFCTTYALILPAITMEPEYICGHEAHIHHEACYQIPETVPVASLVCEPSSLGVHEHTVECFDNNGEPKCGIADFVLHTHNADCFDADGALVCTLPKIKEHIHDESCWQQPHTHEEACYIQLQGELLCPMEEGAIHIHDDTCYTARQIQLCELTEEQPHVHGEDCYTQVSTQVCLLDETEDHVHTDECYQVTDTLTCERNETEGHLHTDSCFDTVQDLTCTQEADIAHIHSDDCYSWTPQLTCDQLTAQEGAEPYMLCEEQVLYPHTHESVCFDASGACVCGLMQVSEHIHDDTCFVITQEQVTGPVLVCSIPVHEHLESCLADRETEDTLPNDVLLTEGYHCGVTEHCHQAEYNCFTTDGTLLCTMAQHTHTWLCQLAPSDPAAVETAEEWEADLPELQGDPAADLIAVAESQLGYREVEENYILQHDRQLYYSRYGAWWDAQNPYGSWSAKFVVFCLFYADIDGFPIEAEVARWPDTLDYFGLWHDNDGDFMPIPADLVFLGTDGTGIVTAVDLEAGRLSIIRERRGKVCRQDVALDSTDIRGYARIPGNQPDEMVTSSEQFYYCGRIEHVHGSTCLDADGYWICQLDEHLHDAECLSVVARIFTDETYRVADTRDTTVIKITGDLPEQVTVKAFPVELDPVENAVLAYDITLFLADGTVFTPDYDDILHVTIQSGSLTDADGVELEVCHLPEGGQPEPIEATVTDGQVTFDTNHFSVYMVRAVVPGGITSYQLLRDAIINGNQTEIAIGGDMDFSNVSTIQIPGEKSITLNLNGYTIYHQGSEALFSVPDGASLKIIDSAPAAEIEERVFGNLYGNTVTLISNQDGVSLVYYVTRSDPTQGSTTGATTEMLYRHAVTGGGAIRASGQPIVSVSGGTFELNGGMLFGGSNRAVNQSSGKTILSGGYLCGFTTESEGGAISCSGGSLEISGAVLAGNQAARGGAVYTSGNTAVTISGGVISGNVSTYAGGSSEGATHYGGGGICLNNQANTYSLMTGGYITNNIAKATGYFDGGGGVLVCGSNTTFTLSGGFVTGNIANSGGGIRTNWRNSVNLFMEGGFVCSNVATGAEGGGISLNMDGTGLITGGYINNNRTDAQQHWGGGGLFGATGSNLYLRNVLITDNHAGGFGGGIGGCSTGRVYVCVTEGAAVYENAADGQNMSGSASTKPEDHVYAYSSEVFMNNGYQDYFCALNSVVEGGMLGGYPANWTGSADGSVIRISKGDAASAAYVMGLNSAPSPEAKAAAGSEAKVFINRNDSYTHGGGILCNGYMIIGETDRIELGARIELQAKKEFLSGNSEKLEMAEGQFNFHLIDAQTGAVLATASNDEDGNINFKERIPFFSTGTFVYYIQEVPGEDATVVYDTTVYRLTVDVTSETKHFDTIQVGSATININRTQYLLDALTVDKRNGGGAWTIVSRNDNPSNNDAAAITLQLTSDATFTNVKRQNIDIQVKKLWEDDNTASRPASVTVALNRNGEVYETVTLNNQNDWQHTWTNLPTLGSDGTAYAYTVTEAPVPGYVAEYEIITNNVKTGYWIPATSVEIGERYAIISPDHQYALYMNDDKVNSALTTNEKVSITTQSVKIDDVTYEHAIPDGVLDDRSIFRAERNGAFSNSRTILKSLGINGNSWLLAESNGGNFLKGCNSADYASGVTYNNGIYIQRQWEKNNEWRYLTFGADKFNSKAQNETADNEKALLYCYTFVGSITSNSVVQITNRSTGVVTYSLDITKVSGINNDILLSGAEFQLLDANHNVISFVKAAAGAYDMAPSGANGTVQTLVTNGEGKLVLRGLNAGTYVLQETKAPADHMPIADMTVQLGKADASGHISLVLPLTLVDEPISYSLPETGGMGTTIFYVVGGVMVAAAAILLITKKRMSAEG